MANATRTDMGVGLGLCFSLLAVGAALATALFGYGYAVQHAAGASAAGYQTNAALAFGASMVAATLAVVAVHVYGE